MSSTFDKDVADADMEEARFLAKVMLTLDTSLSQLPVGLQSRLDSARQAALLQAHEGGNDSAAALANYRPTLEMSETQIPESVKLRLDGIREEAMRRASSAQPKLSHSRALSSWWAKLWPPQGFAATASAFASVCVLVTTLAIFNLAETPESMPLAVAENSLVLASEDEIELYDNLEFYQWLADNGL